MLLALLTSPAFATSYVYDANGRVIAVTNDGGESARYVYDVMGNVTRIDRLAVEELALFPSAPGAGSVACRCACRDMASIRSPPPTSVRFAGIPATVVSGSVGELLVLVPAGAVTGPDIGNGR